MALKSCCVLRRSLADRGQHLPLSNSFWHLQQTRDRSGEPWDLPWRSAGSSKKRRRLANAHSVEPETGKSNVLENRRPPTNTSENPQAWQYQLRNGVELRPWLARYLQTLYRVSRSARDALGVEGWAATSPNSECVGIWACPSLGDINNSVTRGWTSVPPHSLFVLKLCPTWSGGVWAAELLAPPCCGGVPTLLGPNACQKRFRSY